jgi:hypothetical protein
MRTIYSAIFNTTKETTSCVLAKYGWDASPILTRAVSYSNSNLMMQVHELTLRNKLVN